MDSGASGAPGGRLAEAEAPPKLSPPGSPDIPIEVLGQAEVAQLVERNLAKVEVAGSSPVFRSQPAVEPERSVCGRIGDVAEWLGAGLQNPSLRFNSGRRLEVGNRQTKLGPLAQSG